MSSTTDNIFGRRVAKVLPNEAGLRQLLEKKKIRLYQGFDPTAPKLHLGHAIGLKKLMDFALAGHETIFLFGTGTVLAGDPSLRSEARALITPEQVEENIKDWKRQAALVVDFDKVHIKRNGDWLTKLTLTDIIRLGSQISAVQLFKRESFTRRIAEGNTVWFHETMYPLLQGYDSVVMDVDLEIGGTDQEFNMLMGRELQAKINQREKFVLETPMIMGTDGRPMSKSTGNCIWLDDVPEEKFGKLMALHDEQIIEYLQHLTDIPLDEVGDYAKQLVKGANPRDIKLIMAHEIVKDFHGAEGAKRAQEAWITQFSEGQLPKDIPRLQVDVSGVVNIVDILIAANLVDSKSEARRLLEQNAIRLNGQLVESEETRLQNDDVLQVGKRRFVRIVPK